MCSTTPATGADRDDAGRSGQASRPARAPSPRREVARQLPWPPRRSDGRVGLAQVAFRPSYTNEALSDLDDPSCRDRGLATLETRGRGCVGDLRRDGRQEVRGRDCRRRGRGAVEDRRRRGGASATAVGAGRRASPRSSASAGMAPSWPAARPAICTTGCYNDEEPKLTDAASVAAEPITALEIPDGRQSVVVGTASGQVSAGSAPRSPTSTPRTCVRGPRTSSRRRRRAAFGPVAPATRASSTAGADGTIGLRYHDLRTDAPARGPARVAGGGRLVIAPKRRRPASRWAPRHVPADRPAANPHPEISFRALFGKVWYEGYETPDYVVAVHGRHRRLRAQAEPGAADLRHHQGHVLRAALRDPARRPVRRSTRRSSSHPSFNGE